MSCHNKKEKCSYRYLKKEREREKKKKKKRGGKIKRKKKIQTKTKNNPYAGPENSAANWTEAPPSENS